MVKLGLEQVKIVVIRETYTWDFTEPWLAGRRLKITSHLWNTERMWVVCYKVNGMVGPGHEG